jgi:hypothetical protein
VRRIIKYVCTQKRRHEKQQCGEGETPRAGRTTDHYEVTSFTQIHTVNWSASCHYITWPNKLVQLWLSSERLNIISQCISACGMRFIICFAVFTFIQYCLWYFLCAVYIMILSASRLYGNELYDEWRIGKRLCRK